MTPEQGNIVHTTWKQIHPVRGFASELFYFVLFRVDPYSRRLFHGDTRTAEERFVEVLDAIVGQVGGNGPSDTASHGDEVPGVAGRLLTSHSAAARIALLRALHQVLGTAYAPPLEDAWLAALGAAADRLSTRRRSGRNASARPATGKPPANAPRVRVPSAPRANTSAV